VVKKIQKLMLTAVLLVWSNCAKAGSSCIQDFWIFFFIILKFNLQMATLVSVIKWRGLDPQGSATVHAQNYALMLGIFESHALNNCMSQGV
jgi:hypothetical protein